MDETQPRALQRAGGERLTSAEAFTVFLFARGRENHRFSMGPRLEAFSCIPTDGSVAVLVLQLAAFTRYLNELFLSY